MSVTHLYRCNECRRSYPSEAEAIACGNTPLIPPGTKYVYVYRQHILEVLDCIGTCAPYLRVREVSVAPLALNHDLPGREIGRRGLRQYNWSLAPSDDLYRTSRTLSYRDVTPLQHVAAKGARYWPDVAAYAEKRARAADRQAKDLRKRVAFLRAQGLIPKEGE